jgi:hypothetical protein
VLLAAQEVSRIDLSAAVHVGQKNIDWPRDIAGIAGAIIHSR